MYNNYNKNHKIIIPCYNCYNFNNCSGGGGNNKYLIIIISLYYVYKKIK